MPAPHSQRAHPRYHRSLILSLLALALASCTTVTPEPPIPEEPQEIPRATMDVKPGEIIASMDDGTLVAQPAPLAAPFTGALVVESTHHYYWSGKEATSTFQVLYQGLSLEAPSPTLKQGAPLGPATGTLLEIAVRSRDLDPYLVSVSRLKPVLQEGYWYYYPGMYDPREMKWLSYRPMDPKGFRDMYDHATTGEEALGHTTFTWWTLWPTQLLDYPSPLAKGGSTQVIDYEGMPLRLTWQKGFIEYLTDEYRLGEPIYLYLQVTGINGFTKEYQVYVRDFSLVPPEQIVEERLTHLRGK